MRRRLGGALAAVLVLVPLALTLSACGAGNGQLKVVVGECRRQLPGPCSYDPLTNGQASSYDAHKAGTYSQFKPGDQATITVAVVNTGPGSVTGVTVHVGLPAGFRYRSTDVLNAPGATRTQPLDAAVNSNTPIFGLWTLAPPGAAGAGTNSEVDITFIADVQGKPGPALVQAFASGDETAGQTNAAPYVVALVPAAHLDALVAVGPTSAKKGSVVTYRVRLTNNGTGNAANVALLLTLPPVLTFTNSVTPFAGNGARNKGVDPIKNTLEVYYDGFLLPPVSNAGPGFVVIVFKATVVLTAPAGTYPVDVSVTDGAGDTATLHAVAPLTVS
ncbi:MAG TPA: hypothetical protein VH661_10880 [Candidatus Dormibacteraeota bacterium]|nr:hypothetical protein [Candidatus Dormibacteraeota bacterium]